MSEKILVVDDDPETLRLISLVLQRQGYQVFTASTGTECLAKMKIERPDLVLLDVMMPDMDGFEVARQVRSTSSLTSIAILMFSAKGQVEDKVAGFEAGADEYLTKPIHPAELSARIKAHLLARSRKRPGTAPLPAPRGTLIGVLAPKGGLGTSTLVLNLAITLHRRTGKEVIAAEMQPGNGSWAMELGIPDSTNLSDLLSMQPDQINFSAMKNELTSSPYGIRLLLASPNLREADRQYTSFHLEAIARQLGSMAAFTVLDIGANLRSTYDPVLELCNEILLVTEPNPITVRKTKMLLENLTGKGMTKARVITIVVVNRMRSDMQLTMPQMQEIMGVEMKTVISPAPEAAYQAALHTKPLVTVQTDGLLVRQFEQLAEVIAARVKAG